MEGEDRPTLSLRGVLENEGAGPVVCVCVCVEEGQNRKQTNIKTLKQKRGLGRLDQKKGSRSTAGLVCPLGKPRKNRGYLLL